MGTLNKKVILRTGIEAIILISFVLLLRLFILNPIEVLGISMEPNYQESDRLWQTTFTKPDRFDVITFKSPRNGKSIVKRVIGLPGETVRFENDQLYINDTPYDEPYLDESKQTAEQLPLTADFTFASLESIQTETVPEGHYFVLGDNRQVADDSRYFGFVNQEEIIGVVYFRFFPLNRIGVL